QVRWNQATTGRHRFLVGKKLMKPFFWRATRAEEVTITRLRLGKSKTAAWKRTVLREGDGSCPECGGRETIDHILFLCPKYEIYRERLCKRFKVKALTRPNLLGWKKTQHIGLTQRNRWLLAYLHNCGVLNRLTT